MPGSDQAEAPWLRWTSPHPAVATLTARRRARMTASLALALLVPSVFFLLPAGPRPDWNHPTQVLFVPLVAAMVAAYVLARTPYWRAGAALLVAAAWTGIALQWLPTFPMPAVGLLYFTLVPVMLGALVLKPGLALGLAAANATFVSILPVLHASLRPLAADPEWQAAVLFVVTASVLVLIGAGMLERTTAARETANERLHAAERARLQLLNVIAHDLASPLTPLKIQVSLLEHRVGSVHGIDVLDRNINHLHRLIEDVRDMTRIEMRQLTLDRRHVDLADLILQAATKLRDPASRRAIVTCLDLDGPLFVTADPARIDQVLCNLAAHAIRLSPDGATLTIRVARTPHYARVSVQDQGGAIAPEDLGRMFRPFARSDARTPYREKGTGLGLYISKSIIEGHGGRIWVESDGRAGCTFSFEIPRETPGHA